MTCRHDHGGNGRRTAAIGLLGCLALVLASCGDEPNASGGDDALSDVAAAADSDGADDAADAPVQVTVIDAVSDDTAIDGGGSEGGGGGGGGGGLFTQIQVPGNDNTVFHGCWAEGTTRVYLAGTGGAIAGHDGLAWEQYTAGTFPTLNAVASSDGGDRAFAVGLNGTVVQTQGDDGKTGKAWGPPGACLKAADCDDASPCTSDVCEDGVCLHLASGAAGCCGGPAFGDSFDGGTLGGWVVTDLHAPSGAGGVVWSAAAMTSAGGVARHTSPPAALYFGRTDQPCPSEPAKVCPTFDNGNVVGAAAVSKPVSIPASAKATLSFQLFLDVESSTSYDKLEISVQPKAGAKKVVWTKATLNGSGSTGGKFVQQAVDISEYVGQSVQVEVRFDSVDSFGNSTEGVYVDDLLISTVCGAEGGSAESLTDKPFFAVWAANDDDAWAVGADGAIAHWNGSKWLMKTSEPRDVYDMGGVAGGAAFAVGQKGLVGEVGAGGVGVEQVATAVDLRSVAVTAASGDKPAHAVAVGDQGVYLEWDGKNWSVPDPFTPEGLAAVAAVGDGGYFAVTGTAGIAKIFARDAATGAWALKSIASGTVTDLAARPSGLAFAVGKAGLLLSRQGDNWLQSKAFGSFDAYGIYLTSDTDGWAVGSAGLMSHWDGKKWEIGPAGTGKTLRSVWASGADDAWAVGLLGTAIHYDGQGWTQVALPVDKAGLDLFTVWGRSANEVYAAGVGGVVLRWDGAVWQSISEPVTATLRALWGSGPNDVWAVGAEAAIYHYGGGAWAPVAIEPYPIPGQEDPYIVESTLYAVWGSGADDVWAAGAPDKHGSGVLVHWDGKVWTYVPALKEESRSVRALWGWKKNEMLIGGTAGMLYAFDGAEIKPVESGSIATFFGICPYGKDALLVGSIGTVLRYTRTD